MSISKEEYTSIRGALLQRGTTLNDIGREFSSSRESVYQAIKGETFSDRAKGIRAYVEELCGPLKFYRNLRSEGTSRATKTKN